MIQIPGFEIKSEIYSSVRTRVYRGIRISDKKPVVLKLLNSDYPPPIEIARIKREFEIGSLLNSCPGILNYISLEKFDKHYIIISEDIGGVSLWKFIKSFNGSLIDIIKIFIKLGNGLSEIHNSKIIHKDLKPQNIIINPNNLEIQIIDFGISSVLTNESISIKSPDKLEGTLNYISPEQTGRMNRSVDYRTDFYSLGVTLYHWLVGRLPFYSEDSMGLIHSHIAKKTPTLTKESKFLKNLDDDSLKNLSKLIFKLTEKNSEDRYQSADGLVYDLKIILKSLEESGRLVEFIPGQNDFSKIFSIPQKILGREKEIEKLLQTFELASIGQKQFLIVKGFSGIGKSVLINEIHKPILIKKGYFLSGKFDQFKKDQPYSALKNAFNELIRQILTESKEKIENWRKIILAILGENAGVITEVITDLEFIIGKVNPPIPLTPSEAQNRFNLYFISFANIFSSNNHPLVLFLDDLQWVDSASLELIKLLYLSEECNYLFLIGSYRENEIDKSHPLQISLENMNSTKPIHYIALRPLNIRNINKIISTTLKCEKEESFSLAEIVQNKTGGNPFFINQFLTTIYNNELIYFDNELKKWKWDVKEIRLRDFSDNIVEIMIQKILTLKEPSRKILQISSCIGNTFNLYFLYIISGRSMEEVVNRLNEPINNSLIFSISDEYKYLLSLELKGNEKEILNSIEFKFSHDRIQQASYSILEENERKNIHLGIARELFSDNKDSDIEENILEIAHHFNQCLDLIEDKIEKLQVIELNFLAGKKAKKSSAFKSAFGYFEAGISCLGENDWEENYSLSLKLYSEIAEASYLIADYEKMETYCSVIEKKSKNILDRAKAFELRTLAFTAGYNFGESLSISFKVLGELKIYFPKNPTDLEIESSYKKLQELIGDKNNSDFINLPLMEDPYKNLSMYFLSLAIPSAYFSLPSLLPLLSFKMIELSIRHGNSILSAVGYSNLGMFLCGMTGEIDKGYSYGILSLDLLEKYQYKNLKCKLYHIFYNFIKHWKEPLKDCLQPLEEAIQVGVEMGDNEYAAYSTGEFCYNSLFCGESLNSIINKSEKYIPLLTKIKQEHIHVVLYFLKQFALNLSDKAEGSSNLKGSFFNIDEALPFFIEKKFGSGAFFVLVLDMILKFLYRKTNEAYNNIDKAFPFIDAVIGIAIVPEYNFYSSLILLSIYEESDVEKKQNILERVQENQKQLKFWAENSPSNHMYKYHLVEAEFYKIINKDYEASINYDIAIEYASTNNFLQGEAIANELAGRFYFSRNRKKISKVYLSDARYVYSLWGANNKVLQLENEFPEIYNLSLDKESLSYLTSDFTSNFFTKTSDSINFQNSGGLDVNSVLKASQIISGEIVLDHLLLKFMKVVIENAGAERGLFLLNSDGVFTIEVEYSIQNKETLKLNSISLDSELLPLSIINYTGLSKEILVLSDAGKNSRFRNDNYIQENKVKSILCMPILNQNNLIGILYLENKIASNVFTKTRINILEILGAQIAISIQNARLYQHMEDKVKERTKELNNSLKLIQKDLLVAKKIQEKTLTFESKLIEELEIIPIYIPMSEVGGDFYTVSKYSDFTYRVFLADATGHGVQAALITMAIKGIYDNIKNLKIQLNEVMEILNNEFINRYSILNAFFTAIIIDIDVKNHKINYVSAGHPQGILLKNGKLDKFLKKTGKLIGIENDVFYNSVKFDFFPGDRIFIFTDGIFEEFNTEYEEFGEKRLYEEFEKNSNLNIFDSIQNVQSELNKFIMGKEMEDDITVIGIGYKEK